MNITKKIFYKFKSDIVLTVSFILAILSIFFIQENIFISIHKSLNYSVLVLLFCFMVSVQGLSKSGALKKLANSILKRTENTRIVALVVIVITFIMSMFVTNDVALLTFIPISLILFKEAHNQSQLIKVITFQTIAANIGSALTPFGNPQNLFLYTHYNLNFVDFVKITWVPTVLGLVLLIISSYLIVPKPVFIHSRQVPYSKKKTLFYGIMFLISLLPIFHICHYLISLGIILLCVLIFDRGVLRKVDYGLLITFVCFFVFIGNISHFSQFNLLVSKVLGTPLKTYTFGVLISQIISNVPCAILLSNFTEDFKNLILGVNVGGIGTLIASLANVISYNFFKNFRKRERSKYLKYFFWVNVVYLVIIFPLTYLALR